MALCGGALQWPAFRLLKIPRFAAAPLPLQKAAMKNLHGKENSAERQPGQVKALDGVSPQPQNWQRLACLSQALVVEVHASLWITHN